MNDHANALVAVIVGLIKEREFEEVEDAARRILSKRRGSLTFDRGRRGRAFRGHAMLHAFRFEREE